MIRGENQKTLFRMEAVIAAFLLILSMAMVLVPKMSVSASEYGSANGITVETTPGTIEEGSNFSFYIRFSEYYKDGVLQSAVATKGSTVSISGVDGMSGKATVEVEDDGNGPYVYLPAGSFTFDGKKNPGLEIKVSGNSTVYTSGFNYVLTPTSSESSSSSESSVPDLIGNQVTVSKSAFMPEIKAGETKEIQIPLTASSVVSTAQVTLTMPDGLYLESASATQTVKFKKGSASISCKVTAKKDVTDSVVSIGVKSYFDYNGKQVSEDTTFSVRLRAAQTVESNGKLVITGYELGTTSLSYNGNTTLTITVANNGSSTMKDITMTLDGMSTGSVTLKSGMDVQTLAELLPGQTSTFTYQLHADQAVTTGTAILNATAACGDEKSTTKIFIACVGKPENTSSSSTEEGPGSSKPQVIIESYSYGEDTSVVGGSTFTLTMTLRNTSETTAIQNIKMVVSSSTDDQTGGAFTPANSSNSFYVASVGAGETFTESIDLVVKADVTPKSYGVSIALSYDAIVDKKMENLTSTETIAIPVTQPDRFEVGDVQVDQYAYVGDSINCSVSYANKGKNTIYNLSIGVEGDGFTTADSNTYIGNVEAGSSDSFDTTLNASEAGTISGTVTFTYEDAAGSQYSVEKTFQANVSEMSWDDGSDTVIDEPVDTDTGLPLWGKIAIGVGCAAAAVIIILVVVKLKKKHKRPSPMDDYDDEDDDDYDDGDFDE